MSDNHENLPLGNFEPRISIVRSAQQIGQVVKERRKELELRQVDMAGVGNTGNRFVVDLENGKPTVQLQKVLDLLDLLGLEVTIRPKSRGIT